MNILVKLYHHDITCIIDNIGVKSAYLFFNDFALFLNLFINIHEYANYENKIICIFDHIWYLFSSLCSVTTEILLTLLISPHSLITCCNVFINIYKYAN